MIPKRIKVWLIKHLYTDIAAMGDGGDTALAHVNEKEVALLKAHGGAGTINPRTGLIEFKGKGGGGSAPAPSVQESVSYSSNLPEYAEPYYKEQMKQVAKEVYTTDSSGNVTGVQPSAVYGGPRVAGFRTDQTTAQDQTRNLRTPVQLGQGSGALNRGLAGANTAMGGIGAARAYVPGTITSDTVASDTVASDDVTETITDDTLATSVFTPAAAANYMNPYQQQVVDVQTQEARRQADIAKASRGLGSISRGTFGGGRQALMEAEADRALATQLGQIQATGSQQAYQQGQQAFTQDQARSLQANTANQAADLQAQQLMQQGQKYNQAADLQAQQLNQAADLQAQQLNQATGLQMQGMQQAGDQFGADLNKQLGLSGLQAQSTLGGQLGQMGALEQQTALERIQALAASGGEQQRMDQEYLNANKQRYLEDENARKAALEYQSNILRGTAGALGSTQTQYAPAPSMASQIGGLGLAGLGLYNKLG